MTGDAEGTTGAALDTQLHFDFKDAAKTSAKAATVGLSNQGTLQYVTGPNGVIVPSRARRAPGVARYNIFTGSINLNNMVNWEDPGAAWATLDGVSPNLHYGYRPGLLRGHAAILGVASVTAAQFMDLTILHELSHYDGAMGNPDRNPAVEKALWNDCIK